MNSPKQILVIGATTSIGQAVVQRFADSGARLLVTGRSSKVPTPPGADITAQTLDLLDAASLDTFEAQVLPRFGKLDVAVFLAGILPGKALVDYDDPLMNEVMSVNFLGQAALLRRLLPHFNSGAHVIFVSSISGERGSFDPIYAASKAAQIAFVKSLATWLAPALRVNAIAPALIADSSMFNAMAPERRQHHLNQTPTKRLTTKEEISGVILSLCEPAWANVNGQVIRINGGTYV
ncbi:SDR family oxidoreductase [Povalibacter sp.]|uniref:SDR family NAD(P)-dependent oxidoreductase n=1 Tax=Povalibacter sp. TaxID=1962978 RepID=UPI002F3E85F2